MEVVTITVINRGILASKGIPMLVIGVGQVQGDEAVVLFVDVITISIVDLLV